MYTNVLMVCRSVFVNVNEFIVRKNLSELKNRTLCQLVKLIKDKNVEGHR